MAAGLSHDFTVLDPSDAADLLDMDRHRLGHHADPTRFRRKTICWMIYT